MGGLFLWDFALTLYNLFAPPKPVNGVVPEGCAGAGGLWPQYVPPTPTDSRSCCPGLNAMANHGILPHSGRNISFRQLNTAIRTTYNFSPTFCFFVPNYAAGMLNKSYWTDTFDLEGISVHNCIEHDASLTREDTYLVPDQSKPSKQLVEGLLASATGSNGILTAADLSRYSGKRRTEARRINGQFSLSAFHRLFGSSNTSILLTIFGGNVQDLKVMLLEERIPDGWQSRIRRPGGLTLTEFQGTVLTVEFGIKEEADHALQSLGMGGGKKSE
ncbi:chloroperoxidase-like protein [Laetiporus sulphureus 93-53]|uniref:Chloroperoxidase-like protein n=1 Tax=Laetiporus sulphureus 93-53 TaxID=1314785 RepID=A0A165F0S4_9APHY|nr:chloroperoxidase-like protein [Laetiporus sulphureus 93-53]KZT08126.1 chloroperoxidase-like protein [Laetiporus sulphureus 93-53]